MATERLSMRKVREILRQKWALGRTHREVARSLAVSAGAVGSAISRATRAGLSWQEVEGLGEVELEQRLYGVTPAGRTARAVPGGTSTLAATGIQ